MITVRDLVYDYPTKRALHGLSFEIAAGTITALVGPNGAGKTTLMRCLAALATPFSGSITIDGLDVMEERRQAHRRLGFLQDFFGLYDDLTARQCLLYHAAAQGVPRPECRTQVERTAERLGIAERLDQKAGALSRGQRQRLAVAQAMIHSPKVLLLDEPASGLDPDARANLSALLLELGTGGMTLIVSSHILAELEDYSSHMIIMSGGRIVEHCPVHGDSGRSRRLRLTLSHPAPGLERILAADASVGDVVPVPGGKPDGLTASFDFTGDLTDQAGLLRALVQSGLPVAALTEEPYSMQDVYRQRLGRAPLPAPEPRSTESVS